MSSKYKRDEEKIYDAAKNMLIGFQKRNTINYKDYRIEENKYFVIPYKDNENLVDYW